MFIQLDYAMPKGIKTNETFQHLFSGQSGTILDISTLVYEDSSLNEQTKMIEYTKFYYIENSKFLSIESEHISESYDYIISLDGILIFRTLPNEELNDMDLNMEELNIRFNNSQVAIKNYIKELLAEYL